jgi:hypothetical protein
MITIAKIYSDCLYPEFILLLKECLVGVSYDQTGIMKALQLLESRLQARSDLTETLRFLPDLTKWLPQAL